jgi:hypothetical protein
VSPPPQAHGDAVHHGDGLWIDHSSHQLLSKQDLNPAVRKAPKRLHYPLSLRHLEQMMAERGIDVSQAVCIAGGAWGVVCNDR